MSNFLVNVSSVLKDFSGKRIIIFPTRKCNLNCSYCNVVRHQYPDISLADWQKEFKHFDKLRVSRVVILGGEPTLRADIFGIIKSIKKYSRARVSLVTNLIKINSDPSYALLLEKSDLDTLIVSINNFSGLKILPYLSKTFKRTIIVNSIISKNNISEIKDMALKVSEYKNCFFNPLLLQVEENYFSSSRLKSDLPDYKAICSLVKDLIILKLKGYPIIRSFAYLFYMKKYVKGQRWNCRKYAFKKFFAINNDGRLMVCQGTRPLDFKLSQLDKNNMADFKKEVKTVTDNCPGCFYDCTFDICRRVFLGYCLMIRRFFKHV